MAEQMTAAATQCASGVQQMTAQIAAPSKEEARADADGQAAKEARREWGQPLSSETKEDTTYVIAGDVYERVERIEKTLEVIHEEFTQHRKAFGRWLVGIGEAYEKGITDISLNDLLGRLEQLKEENARLQLELDRKTEHYHETMRRLSFWLHQFMGMSSVQKIASLEDFIPRLRAVIDRYGVVANAEVEVPAFSDPSRKNTDKSAVLAS